MSRLAERALFLRSFLAHPRKVGAVLPTSRRAVRDMLDMASLSEARCVVELGAGTGVYTEEILTRIPSDGELLAFEVDPGLAASIRREIADPRLRVLNESAEDVREHLREGKADLIVSGLPYTSLPAPVRTRILDESRAALEPDGTMLVLQYSPFVQAELRRRFTSVRRRLSPVNAPPAFLFACTGPRAEAARP